MLPEDCRVATESFSLEVFLLSSILHFLAHCDEHDDQVQVGSPVAIHGVLWQKKNHREVSTILKSGVR